MMEAIAGENVLNENDEWVPAPNDNLGNFFAEDEQHDEIALVGKMI
jgi:hypothetical protein